MNKFQIIIIILISTFIFVSPDISECFNKAKNDNNNVLCFYENVYNETDTLCNEIPYSSFISNETYEYIDNKLYNVSCNSKESIIYPLAQCCDNCSPKELDDCKKYSNVFDSCCFTKGNNLYKKGCYWLGTKYEGEIKWAGGNFECYSYYLNQIDLFIFFLIFVFIF